MNSITFRNILNLCIIIAAVTAENFATHPNWKLINEEDCGELLTDRIIGGTKAGLGQYPWIAHLGYTYSWAAIMSPIFMCGGALINNRYVLSAAHCVTGLMNGLELSVIRLGDYNMEADKDCDESGLCSAPTQDFNPEKIIKHEDWGNFSNDIALIRLDKTVTYSRWISPICLPTGDLLKETYLDQSLEIIGWGYFNVGAQTPSDILQKITLPVIPLETCQRVFPSLNMNSAKVLCVGGKAGKDSCNGDSGGPLMKISEMNNSPKYVLIGCVSFGPKDCGATNAPACSTRVSYYMPWILDKLEN